MEPSVSFLGLPRLGNILQISLFLFPSLKGQGKYFNKKFGLEVRTLVRFLLSELRGHLILVKFFWGAIYLMNFIINHYEAKSHVIEY